MTIYPVQITTQNEQPAASTQPTSNQEQSGQPDRNFEGYMTCNYEGCGGTNFDTKNDWK
jgi:hypothetical protein